MQVAVQVNIGIGVQHAAGRLVDTSRAIGYHPLEIATLGILPTVNVGSGSERLASYLEFPVDRDTVTSGATLQPTTVNIQLLSPRVA